MLKFNMEILLQEKTNKVIEGSHEKLVNVIRDKETVVAIMNNCFML